MINRQVTRGQLKQKIVGRNVFFCEHFAMRSDKTLDAAYALKTPADNKQLYAKWASSYERNFADNGHYQLPQHVAKAFTASSIQQNILDVGAGTGLVGNLLQKTGLKQIDGIDISPEMLAEAKQKNCYRNLYEADLTKPLTKILDASYDGILSAGTFTNGHVGPATLYELMRIARPNAHFTLSVNTTHWQSKSFDKAFVRLAPQITCLTILDVRIYGDTATGPHKDDICHLVQFRKR